MTSALAVAPDGTAFAGGTHLDEIDFGGGPRPDGGNDDHKAWAAAFGPDGAYQWSASFGHDGDQDVTGVALAGEDVVFAGYGSGALDIIDDISPPGGEGSYAGWYAEFTGGEPSSSLVAGGADSESSVFYGDIAAMPDGDLVVVGSYTGDVDVGAGPITSAGGFTAFVAPLAGAGRAAAQTAAPTAAQAEEARRLFKEGFAAYNEKRYPEAYDALSKAWSMQRSFDVAGNLGIVELELGKYRDAAEHLAFAVENLPPSAKQKERAFVTDGLAAARKEVGALSIEVDRAGAAVEVDGRAAGTSPMKSVVYVDPGTRSVVVRLAGYADETKSVSIDKGSAQTVSIVLVPVAGAAVGPVAARDGGAPAAISTEVPDGSRRRRSVVPPIVLGALGAVGMGVGIGLAVAAGGADSDAQQAESEITGANASCGSAPTPGFEQRCADYSNLESDFSTLRTGSIISFAVGGAAAGAALVYLLWPQNGSATQQGTTVRAVPSIGPRVGGISVVGSF